MKNVCLILWTMIMTSAWWGFGIFMSQNIEGETVLDWFVIPFIFIVSGSILTLIYIIIEVMSAIHKSWDGC